MKIKCFAVAGDAANKDLGALVEKRVNAFLAENPKLGNVSVDVRPDLSTSFGKAIITVSYDGELTDKSKTPKAAAPAVAGK